MPGLYPPAAGVAAPGRDSGALRERLRLPPEGRLRGSGATYAWVEAYIPLYGWLGLDPINNCIGNDGRGRMAMGRNFLNCTPVKGTYCGLGTHKLEVSVHIENLPPEPAQAPTPDPVYEVPDPEMPVNPYRRHVEMQLMQQAQQQPSW